MTDLFPHQKAALRKLSNGKILWGGVGSGKTRVAAEYYKLREAPRDVYVITTAKKRDDFDWQKQFYELGVGPRTGPTGISMVLRKSDRPVDLDRGDRSGPPVQLGEAGRYPYVLTVDSWNNIAKYADVSGAFFIFDEQRLVGSGDWTRKFLRIAKHNHWILLSATPGDTWMDYVPVFVANNFYKNRTEFKREHVVYNTFTKFPKVDRYINVGRLARQRHQLLVEMPYVRHTRRRHVEVPLPYDRGLLELVLKKRWHVYEDRPLRDVAEMFLVGRKVVNSDPSRLEMVKELWNQHPRLIIFYNFNYELEALRTLADFPTNAFVKSSTAGPKLGTEPLSPVSGASYTNSDSIGRSTESSVRSSTRSSIPFCGMAEWNGHKHQPIPTTDHWLYLVQYTAGAEGWNCITTDAMIKYSRNYSWKITEQAEGRIDRLNTPFEDLWYYDFMSDSFIDKAIGRALKAKKTFNESKFKGLFEG